MVKGLLGKKYEAKNNTNMLALWISKNEKDFSFEVLHRNAYNVYCSIGDSKNL